MGFLSNKIWVRIFLGHPVQSINLATRRESSVLIQQIFKFFVVTHLTDVEKTSSFNKTKEFFTKPFILFLFSDSLNVAQLFLMHLIVHL